MEVTPDLAGFREAQGRLRELTGQDVWFIGPDAPQWPPGTPLDPETGRPFDPTVQPVSNPVASASATVGVAFRPGVTGDGAEAAAIGWMEDTDIMLTVDQADEPVVRDAVEAVVFDEHYRITAVKPDGVGNVVHRQLVWGQAK